MKLRKVVRAVYALLAVVAVARAGTAAAAPPAPPAPRSPLTISGLVVAAPASPAVGRVSLRPLPSNHDRHRGVLAGRPAPAPAAVAEAGTEGRFTLEAPAVGMWSLSVAAPGRVPMRWLPLVLTGPVELPPLRLPADAGVDVAVRRPGGAPAAGAWVLVTTASADLWRPWQADGWQADARLARTGADGRVTLPRLAGEALEVHAFAGGARAMASVPGGAGRIEVVLGPAPGSRTFAVRDEAGAAVAGAVLTAGRPAWPVGVTGTDGQLDVPAGLDGPYALLLADGSRHDLAGLPVAAATGGPAALVVPPRPPHAGRILDAATGGPLAGALVWPGDDPGAFTRTGERGAYVLAAGRAWVQAEAAGRLARAARLPSEGAGGRVPTLALDAASSLSGRTVDAAGEPLAGVAVTVAAGERRYEVFRRDPAAGRAVSGEDGRFVLHGLAAAPVYEVAATRDGFHAARASVLAQAPLRLVLTPARAAHGRVVDAEERPLAAVEVTVRPTAAARAANEPVTAVTDERGRFEVAALPAAEVDLEARREGFAPLRVPRVAVASGPGAADLGVLTLAPGVRLAGRVTGAGGRSLAGAEVWLVDAGDTPSPALAAVLRRRPPAAASDAEGRFAVADLPYGHRAGLLVARDGYLPGWVATVEAPNAEPLAVALEPAARLHGRVEGEDGEPVPGAAVRLRPAPPPPGTVGLEPRRPVNTDEVRADGGGAFAFAEVAPGEVLLEAWAPGFVPGEPVTVAVPPHPAPGAAARPVRLVLSRGATVFGRVTDPAGAPLASVRLRLGPTHGDSDAEGRYRLVGVPPGLAALVASHPDYARRRLEVHVEAGDNLVDVTLEAGSTVSGRVLDEAGAGVPGARVVLRGRGERGPGGFAATAGEGGAFAVRAVGDGRFDLEAAAEGFAPAARAAAVEVAGRDVGGVEVVLRRGATLTGRVLGVAVERMVEVEVTAERSGRAAPAAVPGHDGRFAIPHLEPGDWRLRARLAGGRREAVAWVTIAPGDREVVRDLELGGGLALDGLVLFEDLPLTGAQVGVRGLDVTLDRGVTTDHRGAFRVEDLEPGRYRVEVVDAPRMLSESRDVELAGDRRLVIEMTPAVLAGTVVAAESGEGVPEALVRLQRDLGGEPGPVTTVGTDADGAFVTASLAPGRYRMTVHANGYAAAERWVEAQAGAAAAPLTVELEPTAGLWLTVRRAAGPPPSRATVVVLDGGAPVHAEETRLGLDGGGYLQQVPSGTWTLLVKADGSPPLVVRAVVPGERLELDLPPGAPLTVRVPALLDSRAAAALTLAAADGTPWVGVEPSGALRQSWSFEGATATVPDLPAGTWTLRVSAADGRAWTAAAVTTGGAAAHVEIDQP